jgi:anti-sigma regulatory factor (Ser/Thr protein kinase)
MLIASLSHGIKGLLTALDGGVYKVNSGFRSGDAQMVRDGWDKVTGLVARIKGMVLDILFYAKKRELTLRTLPGAELAAQVVEAAAPKARQQGVGFSAEIAPDLGACTVDEVVLSAALVNILENAVDACRDDGAKTRHEVVFRARPDASGVFFEIEDNGQGMTPETSRGCSRSSSPPRARAARGLGLFYRQEGRGPARRPHRRGERAGPGLHLPHLDSAHAAVRRGHAHRPENGMSRRKCVTKTPLPASSTYPAAPVCAYLLPQAVLAPSGNARTQAARLPAHRFAWPALCVCKSLDCVSRFAYHLVRGAPQYAWGGVAKQSQGDKT